MLGCGFRQALARSIMSGLALASGSTLRQHVVKSVEEGARLAAEELARSGHRLDAGRLRRIIEEMQGCP